MVKKNNQSSAIYSGFVLTFEPERTEWLAERLCSETELTESFSSLDCKFERRELVVLVISKEPLSISAMALMERMHGSGGSGKLKMRMSNMVIFDPPVAELELLNTKFDSAVCTPETLRRTNATTWEVLIEELRQLRSVSATAIDQLILLRLTEHRLLGESNRIERLNEQRDGLGLCLDIAQLDRAAVMKSIAIERAENANRSLTFSTPCLCMSELY